MDFYIDIQVKPDAEMRENVLLNKVYSKLHKALFSLKSTEIGVSFPKYKVLLGNVIRLHGTEPRLSELQNTDWLDGLSGYCQVTPIQAVPDNVAYRNISRIQSNMTEAKLRRLISRGSISTEEIKKYKNGTKLKVKILEIKKDENKVRVGLKQVGNDPFEWFKDKQINETVTVKVISSDSKGLIIKPEGCELDFMIKKSNIAINSSDARPARFVGGERIDAAISELDFNKRKANFSIKLLEELQNKEAVTKFSSPLSGKNLPFSSLSDKLDDKSNKKTEE